MEKREYVTMMLAAPDGTMSSAMRTFMKTLSGVQMVSNTINRTETLQLLSLIRPEILVLDVDLDRDQAADGPTIYRYIHQIRRENQNLHMIVLVNNLDQEASARNAGADDTILKGFLDEQVREIVERFRQKRMMLQQ